MADLMSPGVLVKEKDLTAGVASTPSSIGGIAIQASKGYVDTVITISSEEDLVEQFGKPDGTNFESWFSAANFLGYTNQLKIVRCKQGTTAMKNATGVTSSAGLYIPNTTAYQVGDGAGAGPYSGGQASVLGSFGARTPGVWGNNLKVSYCSSESTDTDVASAYYTLNKTTTAGTIDPGATSVALTSAAGFTVGSIIAFEDDTAGSLYKVTAVAGSTIHWQRHPNTAATGLVSPTQLATGKEVRLWWEYFEQFDKRPETSTFASDRGGSSDELHVIVVDRTGGITGTAGTILETYDAVSKGSDALTDEGNANYYPDVIYNNSQYIYWLDHPTVGSPGTAWGTTVVNVTFAAPTTDPNSESLNGGHDGGTLTDGNRMAAYDLLKDPDTVDVNLLMAGPASIGGAASAVIATHLIDIVNARKDSVAFISPDRNAVVNKVLGNAQCVAVKAFFSPLASTSYAVFDTGYKKQYDKYNDVFRWVPLNADVAGACAATDAVEDPWWSPGGLTRGQIRSSIELAFNPSQTERDQLYRANINPVVTFPGEGTVLWGDKTALTRQSAFNRINVRRLFISIEEACAAAARSVLFEFNDEFTRDSFKSMVDPYLRDVQARRGITDFLVVCDTSNNTPQVIDSNEFRADVYVKPARSINFITLTFIATRTGVAFDEVVGRA